MAYKSEADLSKDEKIDLARTLVRFKYRSVSKRELNEIERNINDTHDAEVTSGTWTQLDLDSIGATFLQKGLPSAEKDTTKSRSTRSKKNQ